MTRLTVPQYHLLNRLVRGPIFVYGARRNVANRLAERGLVELRWPIPGHNPQVFITTEGRFVHAREGDR